MAVRGAVLGLAAHLTHRGVQIHRHLPNVGRGAHRPRPAKRQLGRFVELAHMPERERPQKRPSSRRRHHRERQHRRRRARPQPLHIVDTAPAHQHRRHQRQHLATRPRPRHTPVEAHRVVDQRLQTQPVHHRARQQQPPIPHQRPIIEHCLQPVDPTCYAPHRKCLLSWPERPLHQTAFSHVRRPFWWTRQPPQPHRTGGSRLRGRANRWDNADHTARGRGPSGP